MLFGIVGLRQLARQSEASAAARVELIATAVSARMSKLPVGSRHDLVDRASRRGGVSVFLVDAKG
ncbi:MAG: hypothetical protein ACXWP4_08760, partial [Polyangiales bacterium]